MSKFYRALTPALIEFIGRQKVFFTGTAPVEGRVNVSPKGMDSFRVIRPDQVAYLDLTGSGAETAAHVIENGRLTIMFCSFEGEPLILRLYGQGRLVRPGDPQWALLAPVFPAWPGARQVVVLEIESLQTSCGWSLPLMDYRGERDTLVEWSEKKGEEGLRRYRAEKNRESIDGLPTGLGGDD